MKRGWATVVCAASGPSFSEAQAEYIESARAAGKCHVIAVNDNWRRLPSADVLYACDGRWWDVHLASVRASGFAGELWTLNKRAAPGYVPSGGRVPGPAPLVGFHYIEGRDKPGLATGGTHVNNARNSGHQAVNLAYLFGAKRIVLVGYDLQQTNGEQHWFGDHPKTLSNEFPFEIAIGYFNSLSYGLAAFGVEVINASEQTALQCFKRQTLDEALA